MLESALLLASDPLSHVKDGFVHGLQSLQAIGLTKQAFMCIVAGAATCLFFWSYARTAGREAVPGRWGNFVEMVIEFVREQMVRPFLGEDGDKYLPLIVAFFVYIAFANLLGMVPLFDFLGHGANTATGNIFVTGGLAACAFVIYHALGVREQIHHTGSFLGGLWSYFKSLFPPVPIFVFPVIFVVEIIAHFVRAIALALRLFANMLAGHTMIAVILSFTVAPAKLISAGGLVTVACVLGVTALSFLEILVALIQAFVFAFLTTVFLSMAVHPEH